MKTYTINKLNDYDWLNMCACMWLYFAGHVCRYVHGTLSSKYSSRI